MKSGSSVATISVGVSSYRLQRNVIRVSSKATVPAVLKVNSRDVTVHHWSRQELEKSVVCLVVSPFLSFSYSLFLPIQLWYHDVNSITSINGWHVKHTQCLHSLATRASFHYVKTGCRILCPSLGDQLLLSGHFLLSQLALCLPDFPLGPQRLVAFLHFSGLHSLLLAGSSQLADFLIVFLYHQFLLLL